MIWQHFLNNCSFMHQCTNYDMTPKRPLKCEIVDVVILRSKCDAFWILLTIASHLEEEGEVISRLLVQVLGKCCKLCNWVGLLCPQTPMIRWVMFVLFGYQKLRYQGYSYKTVLYEPNTKRIDKAVFGGVRVHADKFISIEGLWIFIWTHFAFLDNFSKLISATLFSGFHLPPILLRE